MRTKTIRPKEKGETDVKLAGMLLKLLNEIGFLIAFLSMLAVGALAGYPLWDSIQVTKHVRDIELSLQELRPVPVPDSVSASDAGEEEGERETRLDFRELQERNADICAWLTLENTGIDSPVVQGKNNEDYLSTNAYGEKDLIGSIFLDAGNNQQFKDAVSVLYGHSITGGGMFSDLNQYYNDTVFFEEHREGSLLLPEGVWKLHVFAVLRTTFREKLIFKPTYAAENRSLLLDFIEEQAKVADREMLVALRDGGEKILTMTTCTDVVGDNDGRTIVLAWMEDAA